MSHFSVCVAIPSNKLEGIKINDFEIENILEGILAPYDEAPMTREHLVFVDKTKECEAGYDKDTTRAVRFPNGTVHRLNDDEFRHRFKVRDDVILEEVNENYMETEDSCRMKLLKSCPVNQLYTFEEYCLKYCGYEQWEGGYGYWNNPNARWDWFQIGGRFGGRFLVRNTAGDVLGGKAKGAANGFKFVNGARMAEIAWKEQRKCEYDGAVETYANLCEAFRTGNVQEFEPLATIRNDGIYSWTELLYKADETLEEYLDRVGVSATDRYPVSCYAFVDLDGAWHSHGDMGWFGIASNEKEARAWHDEVQNFFASVGENDFLVMVDCHI